MATRRSRAGLRWGMAALGAVAGMGMSRLFAAKRVASYEPFPSAELAALNGVVQHRFAEVPLKDFGMRRIAWPEHPFLPTTVAEKAVVKKLADQHMTVSLYIAAHLPARRNRLPSVDLTRVRFGWPPPPSQMMRKLAERAFAGFKQGGAARQGARYEAGNWRVVAVPVNASKPQCVACHRAQGDTNLKLGDPLAAALYVYKAP